METINKCNYKGNGLSQILHLVKILFRIKLSSLIIPLLLYTILSPIIVISLKTTLIPNFLFQIIILISILQNKRNTNHNILYKSMPLKKHRLILSNYIFAITIVIIITLILCSAALIISITEKHNILITSHVLNFDFLFYKIFLPPIYFIIIFIPVNTFFYHLNSYGVIIFLSGITAISLTWFKSTIYKFITACLKLICQINEPMFFPIFTAITLISLITSIVISTSIYKHKEV